MNENTSDDAEGGHRASVLRIVEAMEAGSKAWFHTERQLIVAHDVDATSASELQAALTDHEFPDGTPLVDITRFSTDADVLDPLTAYVDSPEEWLVRTPDTLDFWTTVQSAYERGDTLVARQRIVERLTHDHALVPDAENTLHRYDPETGRYRSDGARFVRERLEAELGAFSTCDETEEILYKLRSQPALEEAAFGPAGKVCVENGVLDISTPQELTRIDHDPKRRFRTRLPIEYDPDASCPRFETFLEACVADDDLHTLQEYLGYLLFHPWGHPYGKALLVVGPTAAGKSTLLRVVEGLLGTNAVTHDPLERVATAEWTTSPGTIANVYDTVETLPERGDRLTQRLGGEPTKGHSTPPKHVFAGTHLPGFEPGTGRTSFLRRWLFVRLPNRVASDDREPNLADELLTEKSGILNWALDGYQRLRSNEGFSDERTVGAKRTLWRARRSPIDYFVHTHTTRESGTTEPTERVYAAYERFCAERGLAPRSRQAIIEHIRDAYGVATGQQNGDETRHTYQNLALCAEDAADGQHEATLSLPSTSPN